MVKKQLRIFKKTGIVLSICLLASCYKDYDNSTEIESEPTPPIIINADITGYIPAEIDGDQELTIHINEESHPVEKGTFNLNLENVNKLGQSFFATQDNRIIAAAYPALLENDHNFIKFTSINDKEQIDILNLIGNPKSLLDGVTISASQSFTIPASISYQEYVDPDIFQFAYGPINQLVKPISPIVFYLNPEESSISDTLEENIQLMFDPEYEGKSIFLLNPRSQRWEYIKTLEQNDQPG